MSSESSTNDDSSSAASGSCTTDETETSSSAKSASLTGQFQLEICINGDLFKRKCFPVGSLRLARNVCLTLTADWMKCRGFFIRSVGARHDRGHKL